MTNADTKTQSKVMVNKGDSKTVKVVVNITYQASARQEHAAAWRRLWQRITEAKSEAVK